tara:strand:- start:481 stop:909 length:429 start_codon:yes stop_codon:yes gene_type:complete
VVEQRTENPCVGGSIPPQNIFCSDILFSKNTKDYFLTFMFFIYIIQILFPFIILFFLNGDISNCDSLIVESPPIEEGPINKLDRPYLKEEWPLLGDQDVSELYLLKVFIDNNAVDICRAGFVIAFFCTIGGVYLCETATVGN